MSTLYSTSLDGTRIAYDVSGAGRPLILLHGTGKSRQEWHTLGYVSSLSRQFQVIAVDMRGSGESDRPHAISDYSIDKMCEDIAAVADACHAEDFALCGYGFGGSIARYVAARSDRVNALVVVGVPFGPAVRTDQARKIDEMVAQWRSPRQVREGSSESLLDGIDDRDMPVWLACMQAMRSYPVVQPPDIRCPALLLAGSENTDTVNWVKSHQTILSNAGTRVEFIDGVNHSGELAAVSRILAAMGAFLQAVGETSETATGPGS